MGNDQLRGDPGDAEKRSPSDSEAFLRYAKPLTDGTDGSEEEMRKALSIAAVCWNLALAKDPAQQEQTMAKIKETLPFSDEEFEQFRQDILEMMIGRHRRMFPELHPNEGE